MAKNEYIELMLLSIKGDLDESDQKKLDLYLKTHPVMKKEFREIEKFNSFMEKQTPPLLSDEVLIEARMQLRNQLRIERNNSPIGLQLLSLLQMMLKPKIAFSGMGIFALGILVGYYSSEPAGIQQNMTSQSISRNIDDAAKSMITNIRFIDSDASDGEVEFEFDAVSPTHVKGKIDDPNVQRLLTHALLNASNAGIRLSTVNAIGNQTEHSKTIDPAIKTALITSLKSDINPGVRREALRVLLQFTFDDDVRDALLFVIAHDSNAGLRVGAINALEIAKIDGRTFDNATINVLKKQIESEQNNYIRNRAVNLVKEIYQ